MTLRPTGWRYLELTYDEPDRSDIRIDGVPVTDGSTIALLMARLGHDGWELVETAPGPSARRALWFKQPAAAAEPGRAAPPTPMASASKVVLMAIGPTRIDPHRRRQLIDAISELTGQSGWRASRIVDKAPRVVVDGVSVDEAARIATALESLGATVEVS